MTTFKKGDRVTWSSHGGTAKGTVTKKLTSDTTVAGHTVRATSDDPQYLVTTDEGKEAAHRPSALRKS
jgi:hypothetical protein